MFTTYAMTLPTKKWTEETRDRAIGIISQWHQQWFPADRLPSNIRVRIRHSQDDEVFRLEVQDTHPKTNSTHLIVVTLTPYKGQLVFDLRVRFAPGKDSIIPHRRAELPPKPVRALIAEIAKLLEVYDAERRISPTIRQVTTAIEGEALAADFINALARRLPILVETTIDKSVQSSHTGPLLDDLVGIAHIAHITSIDAVDSFNAYCNSKVLDKNYVTILWPHPAQPLTFHTVTPNREQIENPILEAAALQPDIPTQAPPRFGASRSTQSVPPTPTPVTNHATTDLSPVIDQLKRTIDEHQLHIEQLDDALEEVEAERDEFAELLEEKEVEAEGLSTEVALLRGRLAELTSLTVDLDAELARARPDRVLRTVLDAVNRARTECKHLEFLPTAFTTANELQGPNPRQVLQDLKALDNAVANWRRDVFPIAGLQSYLRDSAGLDFAPRISEDTHHRHGEWYSALYKNKQIHIGAHLRRGKNRTLIRIYMYVDTAEKSIVIAKIVRHGPDSTS
ncbi:MAG: hypothetical protein ACKOXW_04465 [Actinomycetes bacterium]